MEYLKSKQYYIDSYNRHTVDICRTCDIKHDLPAHLRRKLKEITDDTLVELKGSLRLVRILESIAEGSVDLSKGVTVFVFDDILRRLGKQQNRHQERRQKGYLAHKTLFCKSKCKKSI